MRVWLIVIVTLFSTAICRADYRTSEKWFNSLPPKSAAEIQTQLQMLGFYLALIDGEFGESTYKAIINFEKTRLVIDDGILTESDLKKLEQASRAERFRFGFSEFRDEKVGITLPIPENLTPNRRSSPRGTEFTNSDGRLVVETVRYPASDFSFDALFNRLADERNGRKVVYTHKNNRRFIISGTDHQKYFYVLFYRTPEASIGYSITWGNEHRKDGSITSSYLASNSKLSATKIAPLPQQPLVDQTKNPKAEPQIISFGSFYMLAELSNVLVLSGNITPSILLDFRRARKAHPEIDTLILNSDGGSVSTALYLAHEVHELGIDTGVLSNMGCYSACAYIFFAGNRRSVQGNLGVHQIAANEPDLVSAQLAITDILEALQEFRVSQEVISLMFRTPPDEMYIFSQDEIAGLSISQ